MRDEAAVIVTGGLDEKCSRAHKERSCSLCICTSKNILTNKSNSLRFLLQTYVYSTSVLRKSHVTPVQFLLF